MKRLLSVFLALATLLCCVPALAFTASIDDISFTSDFFEVGKTNTVSVAGYSASELSFQWFVGGKRIANGFSSYTPIEADLESFISVKAYKGNSLIAQGERWFSRLPVIYIDVSNGKQAITKDKYSDASLKLQGNCNFASSVLYNGKAEIKGRGHTSWLADKKPYKLKLGSKANLLGMGKNKHWVLLANVFDPSSLRNKLSYDLSGEYGIDSQKSEWVDVIMDGKPIGVYLLCEHIRIDSTRTDIFDWESAAEDAAAAIGAANGFSKTDISSLEDAMAENLSWVTSDYVSFAGNTYRVSSCYTVPAVTGGYQFEVDSHYDETSKFTTSKGLYVNISSPEYLNTNSTMFNFAKGYFQAFEDAVYSDDFCTVYNGKEVRYTDLADLDSLVIGWLVNDYFSNVDYPFKSTYYYMDIDGKLHYGPVWDMDFSSDGITATKFYEFRSIRDSGRAIMNKMTRDPVFVERARELYWKIRYDFIDKMLSDGGLIDTYSSYLSEALNANDRLWRHTFTFDEDTATLKNWLLLKTQWLDIQFRTNDSLYAALHSDSYVSGMFEQSSKELTSLKITEAALKSSYKVGEALDLSGLELTAGYANGESRTVTAQEYMVTATTVGQREIFVNGVFKTEGTKTVLLKYGNLSASYTVSVSEDYSVAEVTTLIDALPNPVTISEKRQLEKAQDAYASLSPEEKSAVTCSAKLASAQSDIDEIISTAKSNGDAILNVYIDGCLRSGSTYAVVIDTVPISARSIMFTLQSGDTSTYSRTHDAVQIVSRGGVETWTIYIALTGSFSVSVRSLQATNSYQFSLPDYYNESVYLGSAFAPAVITPQIKSGAYIYPSSSEFTVITSLITEDVKLCINGNEFPATSHKISGSQRIWSFEPSLYAGSHSITVKYSANGKQYTYGKQLKTYVREQDADDLTIERIDILSSPDVISFRYHSLLDTSGLTLAVTYSNGVTETVSSGFKCSPSYLSVKGSQKITVEYGGCKCEYSVNVFYEWWQTVIRIFLFGWLWY